MRWRILVLAAAMFALVGACGTSGDSGNKVASLSDGAKPSANAPAGDGRSDEDKMRDWAKCMREHGVDVKDPSPENPEGGGVDVNGPEEEAKAKAAMEACQHLQPNGGKPKELDPGELDEQRKHAKCLREHGIDVPDPTPSDPGIKIKIEGGPDSENAKKVREAEKACGIDSGGSKTEVTK